MQRFYFGIAIMAAMVMVACGSPSDEPDPGDKDVPSLDLDYEDDAVTPDSQQDPGTPDEELPPVEDKPVKIEFLIDTTFLKGYQLVSLTVFGPTSPILQMEAQLSANRSAMRSLGCGHWTERRFLHPTPT